MSYEINGQTPPDGATPKQTGYIFHLAEPVGTDALGRPILNTSDVPWVELKFGRMNKTAWDWYAAFLETHKMYAHLASVALLNPFEYTVPGGPTWVTYSGDDIYMNRPTYDVLDGGWYFGVVIEIRGLA